MGEFVFIFVIGISLVNGAAMKSGGKPVHDEKFLQARLAEVREMLNELGNQMLPATTTSIPTQVPVQDDGEDFPDLTDAELDALIDQLTPRELELLKDLDIAIKEEQATKMLEKMLQ